MSSDIKIIDGVVFRRYKPKGCKRYVYIADGGIEGYVQSWDANMFTTGQMSALVLWDCDSTSEHPKYPHLDFNKV